MLIKFNGHWCVCLTFILRALRALPAWLSMPSLPGTPPAHCSKTVRVLDLVIPLSTRGTERFGSIERGKSEQALWGKGFFLSRGLSYRFPRISAQSIRDAPLQPWGTQQGGKWFRTGTDHMQAEPWHTWTYRSQMHLPSIAPGGDVTGREAVVCWGLKAAAKRSCRTRQLGEMPIFLQKICKLSWTSWSMRFSPLPICLQRQ